jgi:cell division septum initiation protein DivIVA
MANTEGSPIFGDRVDEPERRTSDADGGNNLMSSTPYQSNPPGPQPSGSSGLSAPSFALERRGYDRAAVDAFVAQAASAYQRVMAEANEAAGRIAALEHDLEALHDELDEHDHPTYGGLGKHAAAMLRLAEEQATQVTQAANEAAKEMRSRANREATTVVAQAQQEVDQLRATRQAEIERHHAKMRSEAEEFKAAATTDAKEIVAAARREAEQIRLAAEQETATARTAAIREAEQLRASADREAQEARRALALERERLAKEAAAYHSSATDRTQRLVADSEARAKAAERRAAEALELSTTHREQATIEVDKILAAARRDAEQLIATARAQAAQITAKATHESDETHALAEKRIDLLRRRRDGILSQLAQLRDLVGSFATDDPDDDFIPRTPWSRRETTTESDYSFTDSASSQPAEDQQVASDEPTDDQSAPESEDARFTDEYATVEDTDSNDDSDTTAELGVPADSSEPDVIEATAGDGTEPATSEQSSGVPSQAQAKSRNGSSQPLASVESEPDQGWQGGSATADQLMIEEQDDSVDASR